MNKESKTETSITLSTTGMTIKEVDLFGDNVVAAQDKDGVTWAGVKWICGGLGLSDGQIKSERKKIQEDIVLSKGGRNFVLPTKGGIQDVLCLKLDLVPLGLAKISITPNMKENRPELVDKLVKYQLQAKDVISKAFLPEKCTNVSRKEPININDTEITVKMYKGQRVVNSKILMQYIKGRMGRQERGLMIIKSILLRAQISIRLSVTRYVRFSDRPFQMVVIQMQILPSLQNPAT